MRRIERFLKIALMITIGAIGILMAVDLFLVEEYDRLNRSIIYIEAPKQ